MRTQRHYFLLILFALAANAPLTGLSADPPLLKSPDARQAVRSFGADLKKLNEYHEKARQNTATKYRTEVGKLKSQLITVLQAAQNTATKDADLDEAIKLRDAINRYKQMDLGPPDAKLVRTPDSNDTVEELNNQISTLQRQLDEERKRALDVAGKWTGAWGNSGNPFQLDITNDGVVHLRDRLNRAYTGRITIRDGRVFVLDFAHEHMELIRHNTSLLVLGWNIKDRHPSKDLPNTVAVMTRPQ